ncbi:MAG: hypothetical protein JWL68_1818 [Actinomycetia bacterium]|nr:hypothetical protein [Actinomycetes bacterium]MDX6334227.1 hypothetical protein [Streptosporangiaceae bacterium]
MPTTARITLDEALEQTRTGDIWLFRGHKLADRAIRVGTNSPVNHVGMSVVIEDLPPLMWHAELGRSLEDRWSGTRQRGVQLHDLRAAVGIWTGRYHQHAWLRQLEHRPLPGMEDALLRTIARLDGTPFPSTARLASRWLLGRLPALPRVRHGADVPAGGPDEDLQGPDRALETAYCAEVVAATYQAMGLLSGRREPQWYDPGRFWSGDDLELLAGARLGGEIAVQVSPPVPADPPAA